MKINKNVENTRDQIINTLELLQREKVISYFNLPEIINDISNNKVQITWKNHVGGREVSSKAFLTIRQYLTILQSRAYHALMNDNSIIRFSFVFSDDKLVSQNLLWWPCPIQIDNELFKEYGIVETLNDMLENNVISNDIRMRSPIRIDFDSSNNTVEHPRAHAHLQHHECRINTDKPMCFNKFMKFILTNCYPEMIVNTKGWNMLQYQYDDKHTTLEYNNKTCIFI